MWVRARWGVRVGGGGGEAEGEATARAWLAVWVMDALVPVAIAAPAAATKAHRANAALFSGPGRKFLLSFAPPIVVGGLLTFALYSAGNLAARPGVCLLLYGTAIVTAGTFSVRVGPGRCSCLMSLACAAVSAHAYLGDAL